MKKILTLLATATLIGTLAACGSSASSQETEANVNDEAVAEENEVIKEAASASGNLVVYTSLPETVTDSLIADFEEKSGIKVDLITAGGGELLSRIASESENPQGDIMLSGTISNCIGFSEYFEDYITANEDEILDDYKNVEGNMTRFDVIGSVIIVNTDLIGDVEVNGYEDLLKPELFGKIAMADPSKSSSAFEHLVNMLETMGEGNIEDGWDYVESFCEALDGKLLSGSSAVYKGVADGEYVVGLTSEGSAANLIGDGAENIEIVYMEDGVIFRGDGVYLIKGCPNEENAKIFMDYCTDYDTQVMCQDDLFMRTVRKDVTGSAILPDMDEINVYKDDLQTVIDNKNDWMERFSDIYIDVQG